MTIRALLAFALLAFASPALAAQGSGCVPTTGTVSGLTFAQNINSAIAALISSNSGASAPATDCTAVAIKGQVWLDTSVTPNILKQYDGTTWVLLGALDATNHLWAPPIGGGAATLASGSTVDLWASSASSVTISGTTTVTALANTSAVPGTIKVVTASGIFQLTHNGTSLVLPSGDDITTAVGDRFLVVALTSTNVAVFGYTRADGSSLVNPSVALGTVQYGTWGTIPAKTVYGFGQAISRASYPAYLAAVTRAQSATLTAGNNTITSVGNTAGLGAGMPLEGTGIQAGTTIASVTASTIIMSTTATANGSQTITAFITGYGSGGDSNTVGVLDCRGRTLAGRDDGGTTAALRLTSSYFGASGAVIGNAGGREDRNLSIANLNSFSFTPTMASHNLRTPAAASNPGGPEAAAIVSSTPGYQIIVSGGVTMNAVTLGSGTAHAIVQPTAIAECVVVVLP